METHGVRFARVWGPRDTNPLVATGGIDRIDELTIDGAQSNDKQQARKHHLRAKHMQHLGACNACARPQCIRSLLRAGYEACGSASGAAHAPEDRVDMGVRSSQRAEFESQPQVCGLPR